MPSLFLTCYERTAFFNAGEIDFPQLSCSLLATRCNTKQTIQLCKTVSSSNTKSNKISHQPPWENVWGVLLCPCLFSNRSTNQPCDNTMYFSVPLVHDFNSLTLHGGCWFSVSAILLPLTYVWVWARFSEWSYDFLTGFQFLLPHTVSFLSALLLIARNNVIIFFLIFPLILLSSLLLALYTMLCCLT